MGGTEEKFEAEDVENREERESKMNSIIKFELEEFSSRFATDLILIAWLFLH